MKSKETLEEAIKYYAHNNFDMHETNNYKALEKGFEAGAEWQQERSYSEEDMKKAYSIGWITRERFDDLSPDIIYPKGLDYEEKQDYAFNLWFKKFKKK